MKRMNLSEVPDDVYEAFAGAAEANCQSLNAFVVDRLSELAELLDCSLITCDAKITGAPGAKCTFELIA